MWQFFCSLSHSATVTVTLAAAVKLIMWLPHPQKVIWDYSRKIWIKSAATATPFDSFERSRDHVSFYSFANQPLTTIKMMMMMNMNGNKQGSKV